MAQRSKLHNYSTSPNRNSAK